MLITNKLELRKELINCTEKDLYLEFNDYELKIYILGENYFVIKNLIQSSSENILNKKLIKLNIKDKLIVVLKDLCKLKSSELEFREINNNFYLRFKRSKKSIDYDCLCLNNFVDKNLIFYDEIEKYYKQIYSSKYINENIYEIKDLNIENIYEFNVLKINNCLVNHKDILRLNLIFKDEQQLIISNNSEFIKFTNINNTIEYYSYLCEKV